MENERLGALVEATIKDGELATDIMKRAATATEELNIQRDKHQLALAQIGVEWDIISKPFEVQLEKIQEEIKAKKAEIETIMLLDGKKTVELESATVKMRTTTSVIIKDKVGLVKALLPIHNGIEEGVASFVKGHIAKLIKSESLHDDLAGFCEKRTVSIKAKELGPDA